MYTFTFFLYIYEIQFTKESKTYNRQILKTNLPGRKYTTKKENKKMLQIKQTIMKTER